MLRNYLTVAIRNLLRHKVYSAINIFGLAIGIAFCLMTSLYIYSEWTYDRFHQNTDRIYRVIFTSKKFPHTGRAGMPAGMATKLKREFPEIVQTTRVEDDFYSEVHYGTGALQSASVL